MIIVRRIVLALAGLAAVLVLVVLATPSPIAARAWHPPVPPPINPAVYNATPLPSGNIMHPEDIAFDRQGNLYAGSSDGGIYRLIFDAQSEPQQLERVAQIGGFPLGIHFDVRGRLIVAVKELGLYAVTLAGDVELLSNSVDDTPITYGDELDIAVDGTIYFTDASTRFHFGWPNDLLEATPNGRVLAYDPDSKETTVILDGLYHPNGIIVAPDQSHLLVAESFRYQIRRIWLTGERAGESDIWAENLPIIPDNITLDENNLLWIAGRPRSTFLDSLHRYPFLKNQLAKLGETTLRNMQSTMRSGLVVLMTLDGEMEQILAINNLSGLSSAQPEGEYLYLGTVVADHIARIRRPDLTRPQP